MRTCPAACDSSSPRDEDGSSPPLQRGVWRSVGAWSSSAGGLEAASRAPGTTSPPRAAPAPSSRRLMYPGGQASASLPPRWPGREEGGGTHQQQPPPHSIWAPLPQHPQGVGGGGGGTGAHLLSAGVAAALAGPAGRSAHSPLCRGGRAGLLQLGEEEEQRSPSSPTGQGAAQHLPHTVDTGSGVCCGCCP